MSGTTWTEVEKVELRGTHASGSRLATFLMEWSCGVGPLDGGTGSKEGNGDGWKWARDRE